MIRTGDVLGSADSDEELKTAAVGAAAFITGITPSGFEQLSSSTFVTATPVDIKFLFTSEPSSIVLSQVQILQNETVIAVLPAIVSGFTGSAVLARGTALDINTLHFARVAMTLASGIRVESQVVTVPVLRPSITDIKGVYKPDPSATGGAPKAVRVPGYKSEDDAGRIYSNRVFAESQPNEPKWRRNQQFIELEVEVPNFLPWFSRNSKKERPSASPRSS